MARSFLVFTLLLGPLCWGASHNAQASSCSGPNQAICYAQEAEKAAQTVEYFGYKCELLSGAGRKYLAARHYDLLENILQFVEKNVEVNAKDSSNSCNSDEFDGLIADLAKAGREDEVRRLLPRVRLGVWHSHGGIIPDSVATIAAIELMKKHIANKHPEKALDIAFFALKYYGGIQYDSFGRISSSEFYTLISALNYKPHLKAALNEAKQELIEKKYFELTSYATRLLLVAAFDAKSTDPLGEFLPKELSFEQVFRLYSTAIEENSRIRTGNATLLIKSLIGKLGLISDPAQRLLAAKYVWISNREMAKQIISVLGNIPEAEQANFIKTAFMKEGSRLREDSDFTGVEELLLDAASNYKGLVSGMGHEFGFLVGALFQNAVTTKKTAEFRDFLDRLEKLGLPLQPDKYQELRLGLLLEEGNEPEARKLLDTFKSSEQKFQAQLRYAVYIEQHGSSDQISESRKFIISTLEQMSEDKRRSLISPFVQPPHWSLYQSGGLARLIAKTFLAVYEESSSEPQYYYVSIVKELVTTHNFAEAKATLPIITNDEARRKAQIILALGLAEDGKTDEALEAAPDIIWDKTRTELYWSGDRTQSGITMWDRKRYELIQYLTPTKYIVAEKLMDQINDSYWLGKANLVLAQYSLGERSAP